MKEIESVALIGLGAIGMVVATRLQDNIPSHFTVIADPARQEQYKKSGILFNGQRYDFTFAAGSNAEKTAPKELILIATKATALDEVLDSIAPYVGPDTIILSLINGITSETIIADRFGFAPQHTLYSYFLGHTSTHTGNEVTHDGEYHIYFGESVNIPDQLSAPVQQVKQLFNRVGIRHQIPEDMLSSLWQKYIINIGCNQATALLRCPYDHLQQNKKAMQLAVNLMEEAAQIAGQLHICGHDQMVSTAIQIIRSMNPEDKSSMLQDVEALRPTEIEIFAGTLCRLARDLRRTVPLNAAAYQILSSL